MFVPPTAMATPATPIITPPIRLQVRRSCGIKSAASKIEKNAVDALMIDASPPVVVCCPHTIRLNGITLFNAPITQIFVKSLPVSVTGNLLTRHIRSKIRPAKPTRKNTIISGFKYCSKISAYRKLLPHKKPSATMRSQSLFVID